MLKNRLLRYTNLPILFDILYTKKFTLLNPTFWDDRNDAYYLELYKKRNKLKTVLALCFTTKAETYHHWKVFSDGSSGVCIQIKKDELLKCFNKNPGIVSGFVIYKYIHQLQNSPPDLDELPFLKRKPYKDEGEFRVIYKNKKSEIGTKSIDFGLECIEKINLSPWLPDTVVNTVKSLIKNIPDCSTIRVSKTTLIENEIWENIATKNMTSQQR